jgi:cytochrome P450
MDTTSSALSRILYVLAEHPKEQEKLRQEIANTRQSGGDLSHDELVALPYLDAICRETLRLRVSPTRPLIFLILSYILYL